MFLGAVAFLASAACDRRPSVSTTDSAFGVGDLPGTDHVATLAASGGWESGAGPFIVLPTVDGGLMAGSLLRPDATELTVGDTTGVGAASVDGRLELFARGGKVGEARLVVEGAPRVDDGCTAWPVARLGAADGLDLGTSGWCRSTLLSRTWASEKASDSYGRLARATAFRGGTNDGHRVTSTAQ